ncbi:hypothetical protein [Sphingomonas immobilis]|uniref:Lipoprotein n=1 Tax=Sphingomonas immobilis TaxID=3063997 RepID=A0ABT9A121_9SPHN|nr:hypothetical protein [Sphingomonas sp. CA1-15]MDO7843228.1 hypothetical protein [Sphingomonas sp. CA1-15]
MRSIAFLPLLLAAGCVPPQNEVANNTVDIDEAARQAEGSINAYQPDNAVDIVNVAAPPGDPDVLPVANAADATVPPGVTEPLSPPAPGTPGGLADDRTPISEAPFTPESAQGAADVVQRYYALLGEKKYKAAWSLWADSGMASRMTPAAFAASFGRYSEYHGNVGAPGEIEGAAGSLYVTIPVQPYGRIAATGKPAYLIGTVTLRRSEVDGATTEQKRWHIQQIALKPAPSH